MNAVGDIPIRLQESGCSKKLDAGERSAEYNRMFEMLIITKKCRQNGQLVRPPID